ncbi:MAG TPA: hypothetical protein P5250_06445 [Bacteroidales bacterium]|nr:hypothetical protein [Bacteroidales bacterium]
MFAYHASKHHYTKISSKIVVMYKDNTLFMFYGRFVLLQPYQAFVVLSEHGPYIIQIIVGIFASLLYILSKKLDY